MNKRQHLLNWLTDENPSYTPAAFFTHFGKDFRFGRPSVDKHLAFFHQTDMDFVKIQYELEFPKLAEIQTPDDWVNMPIYNVDFFAPQLEVIRALVEATDGQAMVLQTLYPPFMSAGHTTSDAIITEHTKTVPDKVKIGLERITQSTLTFVRACIEIGVDGFYASTQGAEAFRFDDPALFENVVKPYDLIVMNEINARTPFNILHICDYCGGYDDLTPLLDYPGDVVNCALNLAGEPISLNDLHALFNRPVMGGMHKRGIITDGTPEQITAAVQTALAYAPSHAILGAGCTLPGDIDWNNIRTAIDAAHNNSK